MTREELLNIIETDQVQCGEAATLARMALAFYEWHEKTAWVQTDKRFGVLKPWGKHRADVLKEYIEHLENRVVELPKLKMLEDYLAEVAVEERKQILVGVKLEFHRALVNVGIKIGVDHG
ncbi:hypothetical protein phiKPNH21_00091 [Klebsiella phage phi_KPN_H2]|nr:hypothetical protein phiKPNH21_00091 [Klebsiella phage phi_KPN_H2]